MSNANYAGIDYGSISGRNRDHETGIHYGVISMHAINLDCMDDAEYDYGEPTCPKCGQAVIQSPSHTESSNPPGQWVGIIIDTPDAWDEYEGSGEYACESCATMYESDQVYSEESIGWKIEDSEYSLADCLDNDIFVFKSPYYTWAQFCSPCVPGAGNLNTPMERGEGCKAYCLGAEWFDEHSPCPYPIYRVSDDSEVLANV